MKKRFFRLWTEWVRPLAIPVLLITAAKSSLAAVDYVPSGSMEPTILVGDALFVNQMAYDLRVPFTTIRLVTWGDPQRGDIVVCFEPGDGTRLVKRVIGLPGDRLELRANRLMVNGQQLAYLPLAVSVTRELPAGERAAALFANESLGQTRHPVMAIPGRFALRNFGPVVVPAGQYFMMGDNRDNSKDSRYFGSVPRSAIVGRAQTVVVSLDWDHYLQPRFDRFFSALR